MMPAPFLVIAYGNPSRGDDAAGPLLAERLANWLSAEQRDDVEVLCDFQLNIEHILDLQERSRVLIIDASCRVGEGVQRRRLIPRVDRTHTTHAVSPVDLLASYERVLRAPAPPTELLTVPAASFELGEAVSPQTQAAIETAWDEIMRWCADVTSAPPKNTAFRTDAPAFTH